MRSLSAFIAVGLLSLLATDARANWNLKAKLTCYESVNDGTKLEKGKGGNDEVVATCLGVAPTDPSVANYSLTFDSDSRQLNVIRNCDSLVICDLSTQLGCETALTGNKSDYKLKQQCIYRLLDDGTSEVEGTMICKENESYKLSNNKFKFDASCDGNLDFDGLPCTISFNTGKLFEESGVCPAPV